MRYTDHFVINVCGTRYNVKQISRAKAKKLYDGNIPFFIHPSNASFYSVWITPVLVKDIDPVETSFSAFVNSFEYYNCFGALGKYAIFLEIIKTYD